MWITCSQIGVINPMQTLYQVKNPMRLSNNSHDFSIGKYRKVKKVENNCKNNLTFSYFSRIPCVSPRVTPTLTETHYENN